MMSRLSRYVLCLYRCLFKQTATDAIYIMIFSYLILFNIFNTLYTDTKSHEEVTQPGAYDIEDVVFNPVDCIFPNSSQYQKTPRYICYLLLVFTITIRNHGWLAAGAAVSVLTYSGVAAIHALILFATNNRLHLPQAKTRCDLIPIPGVNIQFAACAGIIDPDLANTVHIVISVMLGALPMAAWSTTFRRSASKAILVFWLLLLAVGHTFYPLTRTNPNSHFQICPKHYVEPLPKAHLQALPLDEVWAESFHSLIRTSQQALPAFGNSSPPACLYSCFATTAYLGRSTWDIYVATSDPKNPFLKSGSEKRVAIIVFWWAYSFLALFTFLITEKEDRLPEWIHKSVFSIEYRRNRWVSISRSKKKASDATDDVHKDQHNDKSNTIASIGSLIVIGPHPQRQVHITVLQIVRFFTHLSSVAAFGGAILYNEIPEKAKDGALDLEPLGAVGQWGCIAVVILVLFAAVVSRLWSAEDRAGGAPDITAEGKWSLEKGCEGQDGNWTDTEEWDSRIGYAS